jgi:ectoine hydroxylase-related dioxygenase (phytanoyl-CoA dioxygenase family)
MSETIKEEFEKNGFVILKNVLSGQSLNEFLKDAVFLRSIQEVVSGAFNSAPLKDKVRFGANVVQAVSARESLLKIQFNPSIHAALAEILDDQPVARFTFYLPTSPGATDAHRDKDGHPHLHIVGSDSKPFGKRLIVWAPIDDVQPEAGPMWVLPGSHTRFCQFPDELMRLFPGDLESLQQMWTDGGSAEEWTVWSEKLYPKALEFLIDYVSKSDVQKFPLLLKRGDAVIFSNALVHGSILAEDSSVPRRAFYTHYQAAGCELWDLGDGIGNHANSRRTNENRPPRLVKTEWGLVYPESLLDHYRALKGFFG